MINLVNVIGEKVTLKNITKKINGTNVEIKTYVDAITYLEVIDTMAKSCFDKNFEYHPEYREIVRRYVMIKYFTDINVDEININEVFKRTQGGTWFYTIEKEITSLPIWTEIEQAVDNKISYEIKSSFDKLCDKCTELLNIIPTDINETLFSLSEVLHKLEGKELVKAVVDNIEEKNND